MHTCIPGEELEELRDVMSRGRKFMITLEARFNCQQTHRGAQDIWMARWVTDYY